MIQLTLQDLVIIICVMEYVSFENIPIVGAHFSHTN